MTRYGYLDMPDDYTDIGTHSVVATCADCGAGLTIEREACWLEDGHLMTHCGCTELPDDTEEQQRHDGILHAMAYGRRAPMPPHTISEEGWEYADWAHDFYGDR